MQHLKSQHQMMVELFMLRFGRHIPAVISYPNIGTAELQGRIILEEVLETLKAMGLMVTIDGRSIEGFEERLNVVGLTDKFDMVEFIDGCCDIAVVTTSALSSCGVPDTPFQQAVDNNNLEKFRPGHKIREDGKLIKPPDHQPPDIAKILWSFGFSVE